MRTYLALAALLGLAAASANGLLYQCDAATLSSQNVCVFVATDSNTVGASAHDIDLSVAPKSRRRVVDADGDALSLTPKPWTQGDTLAAASADVTGDLYNYARAFELIAPLRDAMMYEPATLKSDAAKWGKLTKALVDCKVKLETTTETHDGKTMTVYGVDGIYAVLSDPNGQSFQQSVHHPILQFLEEGAIDLVCVMAPSLTMDRCASVRQANGVTTEASSCWEPAYAAMYPAEVDGATGAATTAAADAATTAAAGGATTAAGTTEEGVVSGAEVGAAALALAGVVARFV